MWAAISLLLKRFATPIILALGLALIALGSWAALQKIKTSLEINDLRKQVSDQKVETAKVQMTYLSAQVSGAQQLAAKVAENRATEQAWQTRFNQAEEGRRNEATRMQAVVATANAERDRLRKLTAAATQPDPAVASGSSCDSPGIRRAYATAETLGGLLQASDGVSESLGIEAEGLASQVRGLQAALTALHKKMISAGLEPQDSWVLAHGSSP